MAELLTLQHCFHLVRFFLIFVLIWTIIKKLVRKCWKLVFCQTEDQGLGLGADFTCPNNKKKKKNHLIFYRMQGTRYFVTFEPKILFKTSILGKHIFTQILIFEPKKCWTKIFLYINFVDKFFFNPNCFIPSWVSHS